MTTTPRYAAGVKVGKAKDWGKWEASYVYKDLEADALPSVCSWRILISVAAVPTTRATRSDGCLWSEQADQAEGHVFHQRDRTVGRVIPSTMTGYSWISSSSSSNSIPLPLSRIIRGGDKPRAGIDDAGPFLMRHHFSSKCKKFLAELSSKTPSIPIV